MPTPFPKEFREDVVQVDLNRDPEVTLTQIAKDFGIHVGTLDTWMRQARVEAGYQPGVTTTEHDELKELRKRNRALDQENEVLRRAAPYLSQTNLPSKGSTRWPLWGALSRTCLLQVAASTVRPTSGDFIRRLSAKKTRRDLSQCCSDVLQCRIGTGCVTAIDSVLDPSNVF